MCISAIHLRLIPDHMIMVWPFHRDYQALHFSKVHKVNSSPAHRQLVLMCCVPKFLFNRMKWVLHCALGEVKKQKDKESSRLARSHFVIDGEK